MNTCSPRHSLQVGVVVVAPLFVAPQFDRLVAGRNRSGQLKTNRKHVYSEYILLISLFSTSLTNNLISCLPVVGSDKFAAVHHFLHCEASIRAMTISFIFPLTISNVKYLQGSLTSSRSAKAWLGLCSGFTLPTARACPHCRTSGGTPVLSSSTFWTSSLPSTDRTVIFESPTLTLPFSHPTVHSGPTRLVPYDTWKVP